MNKEVSGLMVAYNAATTIERALESALEQVDHLIMVDDGSQDGTARLARRFSAQCIEVIELKENRGIGFARQVAVDHLSRPIGCWLDADDIWLLERISRLKEVIDKGADYAFDEAEVYNEESQTKLCDARFPDFLLEQDGLLHQFGRNYLPTLGHPMAKKEALKRVGYKEGFRQAEDYDHLIRALLNQFEIKLLCGSSYREYCSPNSASRDLTRQNEYSKKSLEQINYECVIQRLKQSCLPTNVKDAVFMFFLVRRESWLKLKTYAEARVVEYSESSDVWLYFFFLGVSLFHAREVENSMKYFERALKSYVTPEVLNNIAACKKFLGLNYEVQINEALASKPDYLDALTNKRTSKIVVTNVPLRNFTHRGRYSEGRISV